MSRWSNPFVSAGVCLVLAACQTAPHAAVTAPADTASAGAASAGTAPGHDKPSPATAAQPSAPTTAKPAAAVNAGSGIYLAGSAPVPPEALQQYAAALNLMKAGRSSDAEQEFKRLSAAYPTLSGPEVNLGLLYLQNSKLAEAETAFKSALDRNPGNAVAANELGIVERKLGKFSEAEAAYQRTIAAEPNYAPAYLNLGVLYDLYLSEPQKALEQFEHYIALAGENKQVNGWVTELRKRTGAAPAAKKEPS